MEYVELIGYLVFVASLGYYLISNLQWYNYSISRMIFHHTKQWWHVVYFIIPFILYIGANYIGGYGYIVALLYLLALYMWYRRLDKPLVWTGRVKRFYGVLMLAAIFVSVIFQIFTVLIPLVLAYVISVITEKILFAGFKRRAKQKLKSMENLTVVGVTASYGKTSIKNFIDHILSTKYKVYATPRSVNTVGGIVKDINEDLPSDTEVYIVEMGARTKSDIAVITTLVNPHYVVVGRIGPAHIEYFKTLENIRNAKMEIMHTDRLKEAWVHESANVRSDPHLHIFGSDIKDIEATLEGISFSLDGDRYRASLLGGFNAMNLVAAIKVAKALGLRIEEIHKALSTIKPVDHRLQRIDAGGKIILDDSYNGNIDGMMAAFDLVAAHDGRKVLITPGLVEVDEKLNEQVARRADEVFDLVVVTGDLNWGVFKRHIKEEKLFKLSSKANMEQMLAEQTYPGDLILFANDAPSFI